MPLFSSNKKELILIADIGSDSVGASLVLLSSKDAFLPPMIIESVRTEIKFQKKLVFDTFFDSMLSALEISLSYVIKKTKAKPLKVYCFVASPWYASQVRKISLKRNKEFILTKEFLSELMKDEKVRFEKEVIAAYEYRKKRA